MTEVPILFQNSDFIVVEKPAGISVHNVEEVQNLLQLLSAQVKTEELFPVHRLDKETTGLQVLALTAEAAKNLSAEFQNKSVEKIYLAVLRGSLSPEKGIWSQPLTDKSEGRRNPLGLSKNRIPCETRYEVLKSSKYFSYCRFQLITGRQHQIRKHTAVNKHAIVGDTRYGDGPYNKKMAALYKTERMFLHCSKLAVLGHVFESPAPAEFESLFI